MSTDLLAKLNARYTISPSGCWLWTGPKNSKGYGRLAVDGVLRGAHRLMYELVIGQIPQGLTLDHLCRIRNCVNPEHVEPVPNKVNVLRGIGHTAINARKTHCLLGHPYSGDNLFLSKDGHRRCRTCIRARDARRRARRRAASGA
jgi:hypothetical protein